MVNLSLALSSLAVLIAVIGILANYDSLIRKWIYHFYQPDIEVGIETHNEFAQVDPQTQPDGTIAIKHHDLVSPENPYEELEFGVSVHNRDRKAIRMEIIIESDFLLDPLFHLTKDLEEKLGKVHDFKNLLTFDSETAVFPPGSKKEMFAFKTTSPAFLSRPHLVVNVRLDYTIDPTEFHLPIVGKPLPALIGPIEFDPIQRKYRIIIDDTDPDDLYP